MTGTHCWGHTSLGLGVWDEVYEKNEELNVTHGNGGDITMVKIIHIPFCFNSRSEEISIGDLLAQSDIF